MTEPINMHEGDVDREWLARVSAGRIVHALPWSELTRRQCDAIEMVYWLGLTTRQTGSLLGCSSMTIVRDIRDALKKLSADK